MSRQHFFKQNSIKFFYLSILLGLFLNVDFGYCADKIRFAYPAKSLNYLPVMLGRDKGIYQSEGIDLQMILVTSPVQVTALTTGDIDFSGAQSQVLAGAARGLPVKVIGFITTKPSFWLIAKPEIKSMNELRGKTVGVTAIGSSTDTLARALIGKSGLAADKDVTFFGTGTTSNILTALKGGSIDAGVLSPPFNAMAKLMGFRNLAYFGDHFEQSLSGIGTSDKLLKERPDVVRRLLRATLKGLRFVRDNPADSIKYIAREWNVDQPLADELYRSMVPAFSPNGGMDEKGIREGLKRETDRMGMKDEISLSRVLDMRPLAAVQKEL
jgi:NitT/TauT family transport system substrate-binding protein